MVADDKARLLDRPGRREASTLLPIMLTDDQLTEWARDERLRTVRHRVLWDLIYDAEALALGKPTRWDAATIEQICPDPYSTLPARASAHQRRHVGPK
jgi:hypothetical protein